MHRPVTILAEETKCQTHRLICKKKLKLKEEEEKEIGFLTSVISP